jgi:hypothetical protein
MSMMLALIPMVTMTIAQPPAAAPDGKGAATPATPAASPDPAKPDAATSPSSKSQPSKSEPAKFEPAKSEPSKSDPGHTLAPIAVAYPHPLISEVLFAVPSTGDSDANKSGKREVSGDEFVELVNPHDRSIELRGYTLTDGSPNAKTMMRFTFPAMTLPAHGVVVVFNGHDSKIPGPVGDAKSAPAGGNDNFHKAAVFTMRMASSRVSFSNAGDAACLKAPDGKPLQRVRWGKADEKAGGTGFVLDEIAPTTSKGSVQRESAAKDGVWKAHVEIDSAAFSPGVFAPFDLKPAAAPASATPSKEGKASVP